MTSPQRIVDMIDAGLGHGGGGVVGPIRVTDCARTGCTRKPELGHDFCAPCLAWLRFEVDDDPARRPTGDTCVGAVAASGSGRGGRGG